MKKVIAIASSDWHVHKFKAFDVDGSRLKIALQWGSYILGQCQKYNVPHLFCGDLAHTPKDLDNGTLKSVAELIKKHDTVKWYSIPGNHDMSEKNGINHISPSYLYTLSMGFKNFTVLDAKTSYHDLDGIGIYGIPYYNSNEELYQEVIKLRPTAKKNILLLHTDMPGAKTPEGIELGEATSFPRHLDKLFKRFDLVLCGHIHKPMKLSDKCYMLGSPWHQISSDAGTEMGYWIVYEDFKMEFVPLKFAPKFIKLKKGETPKIEAGVLDYIIPYNEKLEDEYGSVEGDFDLSQDRKTLAKKWCKLMGVKSKTKVKALVKVLNSVE